MSYQQYPNKSATLWMGDVEQYMDEEFVQNAFITSGETVVSVKIIRNKNPGWTGNTVQRTANYAFVEFADQETAQKALLKLNGKQIPDTNPPVRFKLNHSSYNKDQSRQEYSLFVGDLTEEVDDLMLYNSFSKKFPSIRGAKVVHDVDGRSKGFGFVRFAEESDQQRALVEMNLTRGLGRKLIRVSLATPKRGFQHNQGDRGGFTQRGGTQGGPSYNQSSPGQASTGSYNNYYNYWQQQYPGYYNNMAGNYGDQYQNEEQTEQREEEQVEEEEFQDPEIEIDVEKANREFMEQSEELYTALEGSRWHPLDNVMSPIIAPVP